jgi:hypothetical protein
MFELQLSRIRVPLARYCTVTENPVVETFAPLVALTVTL